MGGPCKIFQLFCLKMFVIKFGEGGNYVGLHHGEWIEQRKSRGSETGLMLVESQGRTRIASEHRNLKGARKVLP